ncbi:MAG: hypothetical protein PHC84_03950 [Clostridia bacterium]|nr:hypothetical protein [Clostridia bacterium]
MLLTAHGGALGTGRNSAKYFDVIRDYAANVIEVDIYKCRSLLYISHLPRLFVKKALTLGFVFEYIKKYDFMVNCDVKRPGLVKCVLELAKEKGVEDRIIFTGSVKKKDLAYLNAGQVFLNVGFFGKKPKAENLVAIKSAIDTQNNQRIKGLNLSYKYCTEQMLAEAARIGLKLSVFTVDKTAELDRLLTHAELANITTNKIDYALEAAARLKLEL